MNTTLKGYLRLMRPANLPTAMADIFAGIAIAGVVLETPWLIFVYLVFAATFLYAGGVVLNDVFDYKLDKVERPERPIPSGVVPLKSAAIFGTVLLGIGIILAFLVSVTSGSLALILAGAIVLYDAIAKKNGFFGPLNMGICRGLNLLLGMSVVGTILDLKYAIIPIIYIFAITLISRGEVHGNNKKHLVLAAALYICVIVLVLKFQFNRMQEIILESIPFLVR